MWITAAEAGVDRLFNYQRYKARHLRELILQNRVRFSDPRTFNDPWDCESSYCIEDLTIPDALERLVQWYITITRLKPDGLSEADIQERAEYFRANPVEAQAALLGAARAISNAIRDRYKLYCLSAKSDCELMWAHYGDKHKGICLEFHTHNEIFSTALKVHYEKDYPKVNLISEVEGEDLLFYTTKSESWKYEEEYRLIVPRKHFADFEHISLTQDGFMTLPEGSVSAIIVGCMMQEPEVEAIQELINRADASIVLKRAIRSPDQYTLLIQE